MFNILLISHGNLAQEFLNTSKLIMGEQKGVVALGLKPDEGNEGFGDKIYEKCSKLYTDDGILILADLYGGTPCNTAILKVINKFKKIELLTGFNLAILIEAMVSRNLPLNEAVDYLKDIGIKGICNIKEMLGDKLNT